MSQVFNTNETTNVNQSKSKIDELDRLHHTLINKKASTTEEKHIKMLDDAIAKIEEARKEADIDQKITNNQARLGYYTQVDGSQQAPAIKKVSGVITDQEADQITKIRSVPNAVIQVGQKFASMSGKEPSNISYMKTNIQGLFDLVNLKEESVA